MKLACPELEAGQWLGMLAPAGTPSLIVQKLNHDIVEVLRTMAFRDVLQAQGATAAPGYASRVLGIHGKRNDQAQEAGRDQRACGALAPRCCSSLQRMAGIRPKAKCSNVRSTVLTR